MRTAEGPFPMETTYTWAPLDQGNTRMTLRNRGAERFVERRRSDHAAVAHCCRAESQYDLERLKRPSRVPRAVGDSAVTALDALSAGAESRACLLSLEKLRGNHGKKAEDDA